MIKWIVFLHVFGAIAWIGGMITMRFAIHPALKELGEQRLPFAIVALKNSLSILVVAAVIMGATGVYLMVSIGTLGPIAHIKSSLWLAMVMVLGLVVWKYSQGKNAFEAGNKDIAKQNFELIAIKLMPINIILGLLELFLGVTLRGI
jgi:uncharacterized membrane protein